MEFNFTGKTILVTGAGRGFGRAISIALTKSGCKVYALSRTKSTLDALVEDYPEILPITQDLSLWDETRETLERIEVLDGLVNNAGNVDYILPAIDFTKDQLDTYMQSNLFSAINCTQVVAKKMIASGRSGSIVNMSSIVGPMAFPLSLGYGLSKAGMDFATKQFALELGPHKIRVNSVNPTMVRTDMSEGSSERTGIPVFDFFEERTVMGRLPSIQDIVSPVLYLLSEGSAMVTGTTHLIDAGTSCNISTKA